MVRQAQNQNLDPANLFFDSESRAIQSSAAADDDAQQAHSLAMTAKLMEMVNRMQTTAQDGRPAAAASKTTHIPPPLPPSFAAPEKHQVVPGVRPPEARSATWWTSSAWSTITWQYEIHIRIPSPRYPNDSNTPHTANLPRKGLLRVRRSGMRGWERKPAYEFARSEHASAAAHHTRSSSQAAMGVPASVIFEGARAPAAPTAK